MTARSAPLLRTVCAIDLYGYCVGVASSRAIDEALWRHDVARDTADFTAQYNLGAILQLRSQTSEALPDYQAAVALRPTDAIANNALGCVLLALGQARQAIAPLQAAIQSRPDYFASYYNLGNAYATLHQFPQAISHFRKAVQPNPEDSMAEQIWALHWPRSANLLPRKRIGNAP